MLRHCSALPTWRGCLWIPNAKEELVIDQFLNGMDSHELSVQVAANDYHQLEDMLCVARSLEAIHASSQVHSVSDERASAPDHTHLVKDILVQLGHGSHTIVIDEHHRLPAPGPKHVWSADRRDIQPSSRTLSRGSQRGQSASTDQHSWSRGSHPQCCHCKGHGHFASVSPSDGFYKIGPNGLPIQARDSSRDSSSQSKQAKDKAVPSKPFN